MCTKNVQVQYRSISFGGVFFHPAITQTDIDACSAERKAIAITSSSRTSEHTFISTRNTHESNRSNESVCACAFVCVYVEAFVLCSSLNVVNTTGCIKQLPPQRPQREQTQRHTKTDANTTNMMAFTHGHTEARIVKCITLYECVFVWRRVTYEVDDNDNDDTHTSSSSNVRFVC